MKKRLLHFDVIKLLAILWVLLVHYITDYRPQLSRYWNEPPCSWLLSGATGKLAVAVFAVILGYFAYAQGREKNLLSLIVKRYISFFVMGLFINTILLFCVERAPIGVYYLKLLLRVTATIEADIFPAFWCMKSFLAGSIISYINGKYRLSFLPVFFMTVILALTKNTWIAICLMGNMLYLLTTLTEGDRRIQRWIRDYRVQCIFLIIVFFAIKRPESETAYLIDGVCAVLFLAVVDTNRHICSLFSNPTLAYLGKSSMGVYLMHTIVYDTVALWLGVSPDGSIWLFMAGLVLSVCIAVALSIVVVKCINACANCLYQVVVKLCSPLKFIDLTG